MSDIGDVNEIHTRARYYRKKPVVIEAIQWLGTNPYAVRDFTGTHNDHMVFTTQNGYAELYVAANDRWLPLEIGEWIIHDSLGFYPCKADVFNNTYDEVSTTPDLN